MYEPHFGMTDPPFRMAPDLRFYVESAQDRAVLLALGYSLARGDEFMLLTGDAGTGKTTVGRRLLEEAAARDGIAVGEMFASGLEDDDLLHAAARALGVPPSDAAEPEPALQRWLASLEIGRAHV